jgi:hypothetical protein
MSIVTPKDLMTFSLRAASIIGVGQNALAEDYSDAFSALNGMLAQWNRKRWLIWHLIDIACTSTGAQSYTVGPGGDFNVPRPDRLEAAFFRQTVSSQPNQVDYQLELLEAREDYNKIALKTLVSWPQYIFYDSAYPIGQVFPWPVPQASVYEIHLTLKETLTQFSSYTQNLNLPGEYVEALWTNLAVRLTAIYPGTVLPPQTVALAKASLDVIRGANAQIASLSMPQGLGRPALYNIFSDQAY